MKTRRTLLSALIAVTVMAPAIQAYGETQPEFIVEDAGAPIAAVNTRGGAMASLPDGTPVVYAPTFGEPALLNVIHGGTGALLGSHELGDKTTAIYAGVSADGSAYVAGQTPGANLFRYDPATATVADLGAPVPGETNISRLTAFADDGTVYSGTFPNGHVLSYHPDAGFEDFGPIAEGEQYARSLAFDGASTLYVGTGTNARFFAVDVTTREKTEIPLPAEYAGTQTYVNEMYYRDGLVFAFVSPGYAYLVYDTATGQWREPITDVQAAPVTDTVDGKAYFIKRNPADLFSYDIASGVVEQVTSRGQFAINSNRLLGLLELQDASWPGVTVAGFGLTGRMWHYNIETKEFRWVWTDAVGGALKIAALGMAPDNRLYAAGFLTPGRMARMDVDTLDSETISGPQQAEFIGSVPLVNGETSLYVGSYLDAAVWRLDEDLDWDYPRNPQRIARLDAYGQERVLTVANASTRLAVGTLGKKGQIGGALTIVDPRDNSVAWTGEPVPGYAVASLLFHRVGPKAVLIGGTASHQLGVEHPDPDARLFIFDLQTYQTELVTLPRPGASSIATITQLPDGRIWAVANDSTILELTPTRAADGTYSLEAEEVVSIFGEPRGAGNWAGAKLAVLDGKRMVGNAGGWVYTIDMETREVKFVGQGSDATPTGDGRFFFANNTKVLRATPIPERPATTAIVDGNNWVAVTLTAEDGGGGVAHVEYRVDGGAWTRYEGTVTLKRADRQRFEYRGVNDAGYAEQTRCIVFEPGGGSVATKVEPVDECVTIAMGEEE